MALNLTPLMADLDAVREAFGCKDDGLLAKVLDGSDLPDDDTDPDEYELEDDDDDDAEAPEERVAVSASRLRASVHQETTAACSTAPRFTSAFHFQME